MPKLVLAGRTVARKPAKTKREIRKLLDRVIDEGRPQYEAVYITWRDARSIACAWHPVSDTKAEAKEEPLIHTCGWLLAEEEGYYLIAISVDNIQEGMCDMVLKIPRENVASLTRMLKVKL